MTLLKRIYDYFTAPIIERIKSEKKEKDYHANKEWVEKIQTGRRSKYDHAILCKKLRRNEKEFHEQMNRKLKRWNWLKKLT